MFSMFRLVFSTGDKSSEGTGKYEGKTALIYTVESEISEEEKIKIIELLIDHGADKNIAGKYRRTVLIIAEGLNNKVVADYLKNQK